MDWAWCDTVLHQQGQHRRARRGDQVHVPVVPRLGADNHLVVGRRRVRAPGPSEEQMVQARVDAARTSGGAVLR